MATLSGVWVLVALVAAVLVWAMVVYNRFVALRNAFRNAFAQIDVQLKRRHDLVPNLVTATRAYLRHESETLEAVIRARSQAVTAEREASRNPGDAQAIGALMMAEEQLTGSLGRLFALAESYPALQADETVARLTEELSSTENRIAFARQHYNDQIASYNTAVESMPAAIVARATGFGVAAQLRATRNAQEQEAVAIAL